jgi:DNA primase catalytic core
MPKINNDFIENLNDGDIEGLMSGMGIRARKGKGNHVLIQCISPSHKDNNPSMSVNTATNEFHCHSCGCSGGGLLGFVAVRDSIDRDNNFIDLVKATASYIGETITYDADDPKRASQSEALAYLNKRIEDHVIPQDERLRKFVTERGIKSGDIEDFGLTFTPRSFGVDFDYKYREALDAMGLFKQFDKDDKKNAFGFFSYNERVLFPIRSHTGKVIAYAGRKFDGVEHGPKYINSNNSELFQKNKVLYGLDVALKYATDKRLDNVTVVEGYMDVIAAHRAGMRDMVGTMGTALTTNQLKLLSRFTNQVTFLFDPDVAGSKAADRAMEVAAPFTDKMKFKFARLPAEGDLKLDPDAMIRAGRLDELKALIAGGLPFSQAASEYILRNSTIQSPEDLIGAASDRAQTLYLAMPPSIVRETMSQCIAADISRQLNLNIDPALMGMRMDQEAVAINFPPEDQPVPAPLEPQPKPVVETTVMGQGIPGEQTQQQRRPEPKQPAARPSTQESGKPSVEIPALSPASFNAKWIALKSADSAHLTIHKVLDKTPEGFSISGEDGQALPTIINTSKALEVAVTRTMKSKYDTPEKGVKKGDEIYLINGEWLKTIEAKSLSVAQSLVEHKRPSIQEDNSKATPQAKITIKPDIGIPVLNPASLRAEWIAMPSEDPALLSIHKVLERKPEGLIVDIPSTGRAITMHPSDVLEVPVTRTMKSKYDTPEKGVKKGDEIYLIDGDWMKTIVADSISVVPSLDPYKAQNPRQKSNQTKSATKTDDQPSGNRPKSAASNRRTDPFSASIQHRKPEDKDWIATKMLHDGSHRIGQVRHTTPNATNDLSVSWLNHSGPVEYISSSEVHTIKVDRAIKSNRDNPDIGISAGDTIVKIGNDWHGQYVPAHQQKKECKAKKSEKNEEYAFSPQP